MATPEPITEMMERLKCGICLTHFKDPRLLECGHAFCTECIDRHFKTREKNFALCPICRKNYWPPNRDVTRLPKAIYIQQLLEMRLPVVQICEESGCCRDRAIFLCLTCRQWLCDTCKLETCGVENDNTAHNAFTKEEIEPFLFDVVTRSRHKLCPMHQSHDLEWYCPKCRMLICKLCKANNHLHHILVDSRVQSRDSRKSLEQTVASLQKKADEHRTNHELYKNIVSVDLIDTGNCNKIIRYCDAAIGCCEELIGQIRQLLTFGSDEVVLNTLLNMEERIDNEMKKCYSQEVYLKGIQGFTGSDLTERSSDPDNNPSNTTQHIGSYSAIFIYNVNRPHSCESLNCVCEKETKAVLLICMRCQKWICDYCKKRRCSDSLSNHLHEAVLPGDIDRTLYDIILRSRHDKCNEHSEHAIDNYCCTCKVLLCNVCQTGHLHHIVKGIKEQSSECCDKMEHYQASLQKQIKDYSKSKDTFLEIQKSPCLEPLNLSYCATIVKKCDAGIDRCNIMYRDITSLLLYGSHRVIIEMFVKMEPHIESELKTAPLEPLTRLERFADFLTKSLHK